MRAKAAAAAACLPAHLLAELTVRVALGSMLLFMFPRTVHHEHALRDIAARFTAENSIACALCFAACFWSMKAKHNLSLSEKIQICGCNYLWRPHLHAARKAVFRAVVVRLLRRGGPPR